jgi:hypothetical protein
MRLDLLMVPLAAWAVLSGCDAGGLDGDFQGPEPSPPCIEAADRPANSVTVAGVVVDHATGEPVDSAEVAVNTAWDVEAEFPGDCDPLATLTTSPDGLFGPKKVDVGSNFSPPIAIFMVSGGGLADTASDETLTCGGVVCDDVDHTVAAPSRSLAAAWRAELEAGGMPDAGSRGLILFEYREPDGSPAEGVTPAALSDGARELTPDVEVRFLDDDRVTLAPPGTAATTASGLALIGIGDDVVGEYVYGLRGDDDWQLTGVLDPAGWIFVEQLRLEAAP